MKLQVEYVPITEIKPYRRNAKLHPQEQIEQIKNSMKEFGNIDPIGVWHDEIVEGHGRYEALKQMGAKEIPIIRLDDLTDEQRKAYALVHNKLTMNSDFDVALLDTELAEIETIDMTLLGFDDKEEETPQEVVEDDFDEEPPQEVVEDDFDEEPPAEPKAKYGDLYQLGRHKLLCGDSTKIEDVQCLMGGHKADMVFTDPPYGMKKENEGVANDNLNFDDLLAFNKEWIPLSFSALKENGSWYCWGIDEPLMDIYAEILKPMQKENKITFRNLITWDKGNGQGQLSEDFRMYPIADEKCLFVMRGVQGADGVLDASETLGVYLKYMTEELHKSGLTEKDLNEICGYKSIAQHWTLNRDGTQKQPRLIQKDDYKKIQKFCRGNGNDAFKKEYDEIKKEWYETQAYFDNTHDIMNNVWHFDRAGKDERVGHATPKPIALCSRAIKSSSRENEIVLDLFGGSGSTLMACEQLNRQCFMMELEPQWVDVIINRWGQFTGQKAVKLNAD